MIPDVNEFQKVTNPMSIEPIKAELAGMLAQANRKIEEAESRRANGTDQERVHAAGQLVFLKGQKEELDVRTRALSAVKDSPGATFAQWIKEDWSILMQRLQILIEQ